jgi:electron-transferring-flavoprotein dehydrogenase
MLPGGRPPGRQKETAECSAKAWNLTSLSSEPAPAGLSAACRIMQLAQEREHEVTVCVVEKGSEVGAHILSGAVLEPRALDELFPDWKNMGAPVSTAVTRDEFLFYTSATSATALPHMFIPKPTHNDGNYIVSMGNVCRWLAEQAENLGVEVYPGFAAAEVLYAEDGSVRGIATGDMGVRPRTAARRTATCPAWSCMPATPCSPRAVRGHLGKQLMERFGLDEGQRSAALRHRHQGDLGDPAGEARAGAGRTRLGWPLKESGSSGGAFLYHADDNQVYIGLITDLNYSNPHVSPYEEFQRWKHHPETLKYLEGGTRLSQLRRPGDRQGWPQLTAANAVSRRPADRLRRGHAEQRQDQGQPHGDEERHAGGGGGRGSYVRR